MVVHEKGPKINSLGFDSCRTLILYFIAGKKSGSKTYVLEVSKYHYFLFGFSIENFGNLRFYGY